MNPPKLHIKYAYPLDTDRRSLFVNKNLGYYPPTEEVISRIAEWKTIWNHINQNDKVFCVLIDITSINLPRDLEMYVFGTGLNAMSNPLIVPIVGKDGRKFTDNEFIETAIHEIIHRFVGDLENNPGIGKYWESIRIMYEEESKPTQNHIVVYAVLELVLLELFGRDELKNFIHPIHPDYKRAVTIVSDKKAENLVKQFRNFLESVT